MAGITLDEFEKQVTQASLESAIVASIAVNGVGVTWLRLRVHLLDGSFIEAYCNETAGRIAYALIQEQQRIFGADNTGGWHWHPFEAPESHVPSTAAISFAVFLDQIERQIG
jgi:hypothetical protein